MIEDSNIVIYAAEPGNEWLRDLIQATSPDVSAISLVEVLGTTRLTEEKREIIEAFFIAARIVPVSEAVIENAINLRRLRRMTLGDALIAATALLDDGRLMTRNAADFAWIPGLTIVNPFDGRP